MSIATEVVYVDGVTTVDAAWLNLIQEHLAGHLNLRVSASGQTVTISAGADDAAATAYINGEQRRNEADITFDFIGADPTDTYDVYVVGDGGGDDFTMEVVSGAPAGTNTRKVAEVDYDTGTDVITDLRLVLGPGFEQHDHTALSGTGEVDHGDIGNPGSDDIHTQYSRIDGSRDFGAAITGVDPVGNADFATKQYADGLLTADVPVGTLVPFAAAAAPGGWLLCDGASFLNATFPLLAAVLNDVYGGDGGTNTNVPDMRGVFAFGKPDAGEGSSLADTGGALDHTHTQAAHTHAEQTHSHTMGNHTHTTPNTDSGGGHTHTQGITGSGPTHTHTGPSHTHSDGSYVVAKSGAAVSGSRASSAATAGLFSEDDLDQGSSTTEHSHAAQGSLREGAAVITGNTGSNFMSHTHIPIHPSNAHQHNAGAFTGSSASGGTGATGANAAHTHSNGTVGSSGNGAHTHTVGDTAAGSGGTGNDSPGTTGSDGGDTFGSSNPSFQVVQYIIKTD